MLSQANYDRSEATGRGRDAKSGWLFATAFLLILFVISLMVPPTVV